MAFQTIPETVERLTKLYRLDRHLSKVLQMFRTTDTLCTYQLESLMGVSASSHMRQTNHTHHDHALVTNIPARVI